MWIVCITSVRHVLTVNGYGGRQTKENEKSWCFKGWETLVKIALALLLFLLLMLRANPLGMLLGGVCNGCAIACNVHASVCNRLSIA